MPLILIIDDNQENILFLEVYLQTLNMDTISAFSGKTGVQLALEHQPDAILTDLHMPAETWDGFATIAALRTHQKTQRIPVIAVTSLSCCDISTHSPSYNEILYRPFRMHHLAHLINHYLDAIA